MSQYEHVGIVRPTESRLSSYIWEVKSSYISCKRNGNLLISPVFSTMCSSTEHKWVLNLYPKGNGIPSNGFISLCLKYMGQNNVEVDVTLSLIDDKYCKVNKRNFQKLYVKSSPAFGYPNFIEENFVADKTNRVLVDDSIKILCEIIHDSNLVPLKNSVEENLPDYCRLKEFDDFEKLLEAENSTDVIVRIGKDEIKVHKAIIMCRSPVFQAMFEHDMKEKDQNVIEITDIKYEIMKEVFRFMYVGKVSESKKMAGDLLLAADKYCMKGLKVLSENQLFESLTISNAIDYLKLADMSHSNVLKSKIIEFIIRNQKDFIDKPELKLLPVELFCEVFSAVVRDNLNK